MTTEVPRRGRVFSETGALIGARVAGLYASAAKLCNHNRVPTEHMDSAESSSKESQRWDEVATVVTCTKTKLKVICKFDVNNKRYSFCHDAPLSD